MVDDEIFQIFVLKSVFLFRKGSNIISHPGKEGRGMCVRNQLGRGLIQPDTQEKISHPIYKIHMVKMIKNATMLLNLRAEQSANSHKRVK